jgi:hypothetical protein
MQHCCIKLYICRTENKSNMKKVIRNASLVLVLGSFIACSDSEPDIPVIPNEEELITTLKWQLVSLDAMDTLNFIFRDLDGDGGADPTLVTPDLKANTSYTAELQLLNELENPFEDITIEVLEEAEQHQFFFESTVADLSVSYADLDINSKPIGILSTVQTADTASGVTIITLRHLPDKFAAGVSDGSLANAGGETDISVSFTMNVKP